MRPPFPARRDPRTPWLGFHPAWKRLLRPSALFGAQPAILYWVGGTGNWSDGAHWALYSGGPGSGYKPTSETNLRFDVNSGAGTSTHDAAISCKDLDFTGYTGTFTSAGPIQTIYGSLTLSSGMTTDGSGAKTFAGTGAKTITFAGKTDFGSSWTFNGAGSVWTLQDAVSIGGQVSITNGELNTNGQTFTFFGISMTSGTFTLTLGASTINDVGNWAMTGGSLTVNAGTSTINLSTSSAFFTGAGKTYNIVNFTSSSGGARGINSANTFATLTITSGATTINNITLGADQVVTGTFTLTGNSASNRPLLQSDTVGTARTISATAATVTDVDFQDITGAGAAAPFTGTRLGDCKGNLGITFTVAADKFYIGNTANWNGTVWALTTGGAAGANNFPLPQDTAIFDANSFSANSQTVTTPSAFRMGTVDFSAMTLRTGITFATTGQSLTFFGNFVSTTATGFGTSGTGTWTFSGRGTQTFTSSGVSWTHNPTVDSLGGTLRLVDAYTTGSAQTLTLTRGTLDLNGKVLATGLFDGSNSNARTIKSSATGGILRTLSTSAATVFDFVTGTNATIDRTGNNWSIEVGGNTTNTRTMSGGSKTWPTVTFTNTTAVGRLNFTGSNTFKSLLYTGGTAQTFGFTAATTTTIEDDNGFPSGTLGNVVTIASITAANHNLAKSGGGVISRDFLSISRSQATPATPKTWFAGHNSTDGGNNTGWVFTGDGTASPQDGTLSFIGAIAKRFPLQALTGTLSFIGAVASSLTHTGLAQAFTAALSFIGSQAKRTSHLEAGVLSFIGAVAKRTVTARTAALSFIGNCLKATQAPKAATLTSAGSLAKRTSHPLSAALNFIGACLKSVVTSRTAALTFAGSFAKRTGKALAGALSFAGVWTRVFTVIRVFTATLSFAGVFSRSFLFRLAFMATLSFSGLAEPARVFRRWIFHVLRRAPLWNLAARPAVWHQQPRPAVWRLPRRGPPRW